MEQQKQAPHIDTLILEMQNSVSNVSAALRNEIVRRSEHIDKLNARIAELEKDE